MPQLTFAISPMGLRLPVFVGLSSGEAQLLATQGLPVPRPIQVQAEIDTGSLVTAVAPHVLNSIGATPGSAAQTLTASGNASVKFYRVSFTAFDDQGRTITRTDWLVTSLPRDPRC